MLPLWVILLSALVTCVLGLPAYGVLRRLNIIDRPNERSSHERPTVRGGGIAIMATIILAGPLLFVIDRDLLLLIAPALAAFVAVISFIDDLRSLNPVIRFGCHAIAAGLLLFFLAPHDAFISLSHGVALTLPSGVALALFFFWLAGYTNAFNFMDGINGIAAMQAALTGLGMALVSALYSGRWDSAPILLALVLAGTGLGFLPHNFPRARMFMGDVSSAPLGLLLAFDLLWLCQRHGWALLLPLFLLHANFVLDTAFTLVRRMARGEKWYHPHREHFYQRLIRSGKSHPYVTGWEAVLQLLSLVLMLLYIRSEFAGRLVTLALTGILWIGFFAFAERRFRASSAAPALSQKPLSESIPA